MATTSTQTSWARAQPGKRRPPGLTPQSWHTAPSTGAAAPGTDTGNTPPADDGTGIGRRALAWRDASALAPRHPADNGDTAARDLRDRPRCTRYAPDPPTGRAGGCGAAGQ